MAANATVSLPTEAHSLKGHYSIILADSHVRFRREMRKILDEHTGLKVSGEASNRDELFGLLEQSPPALVILDVGMPDLRAREGIPLIKLHYPEVKVLIMVMDQEPEYLSQGLATGAAGVLPKQYVAGQIFLAIAAVRRGEVYIPPRLLGDSPALVQPARGEGHYIPDHG
jgi:DNA-binding NarL/FixJ family response regulator